ncbi:MAG: ABC transporter permease [Gemmatimonadetes bacterium]|nr:ABC transporter permease [Gemmatimonadota bacterium]
MLGNYLTTALRLLWRERGYAAINIFGLAIGLALCLLIVQFSTYHLSVGDFHDKKDRVFRVLGPNWQIADDGEFVITGYGQSLPIELGPTLQEQLPEVAEAVRFRSRRPVPLQVGDKDAISGEVLTAEAGVFDVFSFPLLRGDPKTALTRPYTMVLTEPLARRLFGDSDPIGQVVRYEQRFDCEVTGIVGQPPASSLLQFSALLSFETEYEESRSMMETRTARAFITFVELTPGADPAALAAGIPSFAEKITGMPEPPGSSYMLQPLEAIRFDAEVPNNLGPSSNLMYLAICAILAVVILTIAGVNYVNLATARAGRRTHEIGVRKTLGAHRGQLVRQLLSESVLLSTAATVLGAVLTKGLILLVPVITGFDFEIPFLDWTLSACAGAAALAVGVGLVAGAYPAWVVARFQPTVAVSRGRVGGARLRQGLVVAQFTITAALMTMTLLIWHQIDFIQNLVFENSPLGFEPEQVVVVHNHGMTGDEAQVFKTELLQDSRIAAVSLAETVPGGFSKVTYSAEPEGAGEVMMRVYGVDGDFVEIMGLRMAQGRTLTDDPADDRAIVINEAAVQMLGWEEPLGKMIYNFKGQNWRVVGVIEDFHFDGPHRKIQPLLMGPVTGWVGAIIVQVQPGHLEEALKVIDDKWAAIKPYRPINRQPLEEVSAGLYFQELLIGRALTFFLVLSLVVASVGLFGMAAHAAQERTKEIGIRKVFGASLGGLTAMLLRDFAKPVAIAFLLSVPIAYWLANLWLQDFAYHVEVGVGLFLVSGALSFAIAGLTVGHQAMRAALSDPIETLRTE